MQNDSTYYLSLLAEQERLQSNRFAGIRTILVVFSSSGMAFDQDGLRSLIVATYPDAAVFFMTTQGKCLGARVQGHVDLLVDFTAPGNRQGWFFARRLRRMARFAVGRNAGLFRKRIYDRVFDEKEASNASRLEKLSTLAREREASRQVLALAGVASVPHSRSAPDRSHEIALELPPMVGA